jgi:uncharacterized membrane protein
LAAPITSKRIQSIDLLRGTVIAIMALDHVRDYFHGAAYIFDPTDLSRTDGFMFFTRWITHFCAPVFTFLAGTSAYLNGTQKTKKQLSAFLFSRGLWLVIAEILIITFGWTFNPAYPVFILQVIWALGVSMMVLSAMVWLPETVILITGLVLIFGHNLLDPIHVTTNDLSGFLIGVLHEQHFFPLGDQNAIMTGYPIIPWIGIMCTGYALGKLYLPSYDAAKRKKWLLTMGLAAIALFIVIRFINSYGDPRPWSVQQTPFFTFLSFLNTTKYPPSLLYILMTLGPALLFLAFTEKPLNAFTQKLVVLGRVPMFFYIIHIYILHLLGVIAVVASGHPWHDMVLNTWVTANQQLQGYGYPLWFVYALWIVVMIGLYPLCQWYDGYKRTHREKWWLSYV